MSYKAKKYSVKHVDFNSLSNFIKFGTYPPGITENGKRNLRKRAQSFKVVDNQLFYTPVSAAKEDGEPEISRPVISDGEEIQKLLSDLHVDEKGNHLGREKLGNKIREKFYFIGITKIVNSYIDNCSYCQVNRPSSRSSSILSEGSLSALSSDTEEGESLVTTSPTCTNRIDVKVEGHSNKLFEAHRFWEIVEMNVLGPFSCKESKYYVVLFLDLFSYWPEAFVVDSLSPSTITHLLLKLLCRFGNMRTLMIRQTSESVQDNVIPRQDILAFIGLEITINHFGSDSTYVIWDDIKESVKNFTDNNNHWPFCLEFCLLPFRISRAENSEYTPSYITYGREISIPDKIHQQNETSCMAADPHLNTEQMAKISIFLLEALKMFGKYSQPVESASFSDLHKDIGRPGKSVPSPTESSTSLISKAYNTRRSRDVNYRRLSTNGDVDPEAEEDMPPPTIITPEPRRKRRKMSRPGRVKVEDEELEDGIKEEKEQESSKNSSMDETDEYYASIILYKTQKAYSPRTSHNQKRLIRKAALSYEMENGVLYRPSKEGRKQVATCHLDRLSLLQKAHVDAEGKHFSMHYMWKSLKDFTWKGLFLDCVAFAKACPGCDYGNPLSDSCSPEEEDEIAKHAEANYSHLVSYVKNGKFSPDTDTSIHRAVLEVAKYFTLSHGQLMYRRSPKSGLRFFEISTRGKKAAIKNAHEIPAQDDHLSPQETYENLTSSYLWYRMKESVSDYVKQCCDKPNTAQHVSKSRINFFTKYFSEQQEKSVEVRGSCTGNLEMTVNDLVSNIMVAADGSDHQENYTSPSSSVTSQPTTTVLGRNVCPKAPNHHNTSFGNNQPISSSNALSHDIADCLIQLTGGDLRAPKPTVQSSPENSMVTSSDPVTASAVLSILPQVEHSQVIKEADPVENTTDNVIVREGMHTTMQQKEADPVENTTDNVSVGEGMHTTMQQKEADPVENTADNVIVREGMHTTMQQKEADSVKSNITVIPDSNFPILKDHKYDKNTKKKFECKICRRKIRGMSKFQTHMYQHTGVKPYECELCQKRFTHVKSLRIHKRKHTGVYPYLCNICGKRFTSAAGVRLHVKNHSKGGGEAIQCESCDRSFLTMNRYEKHRQFKHLRKEDVFKCKECSKIFTTKRSMMRHHKSYHLGVRYHTCELCGKSFFRKEYFTAHMNHHKTQKEEPGNEPVTDASVKVRSRVITETIVVEPSQPGEYYSLTEGAGIERDRTADMPVESTYYAIPISSSDVQGGQLVPLHLEEERSGQGSQNVISILQEGKASSSEMYGFTGVQYEIECGEEGIDAETLSAISLVTQGHGLTQSNFQQL